MLKSQHLLKIQKRDKRKIETDDPANRKRRDSGVIVCSGSDDVNGEVCDADGDGAKRGEESGWRQGYN